MTGYDALIVLAIAMTVFVVAVTLAAVVLGSRIDHEQDTWDYLAELSARTSGTGARPPSRASVPDAWANPSGLASGASEGVRPPRMEDPPARIAVRRGLTGPDEGAS